MISSINDPHYWGSKYIGARRVENFASAPTTTVTAVVAKLKENHTSNPTRADIAST